MSQIQYKTTNKCLDKYKTRNVIRLSPHFLFLFILIKIKIEKKPDGVACYCCSEVCEDNENFSTI